MAVVVPTPAIPSSKPSNCHYRLASSHKFAVFALGKSHYVTNIALKDVVHELAVLETPKDLCGSTSAGAIITVRSSVGFACL